MAPSEEALSTLCADWRRLGISFTGKASPGPVDVESLILRTPAVGGADERLTVCASSARVRAYLGALLSLAIEAPDGAGRAPQFDAAISHCRLLRPARAFYDSAEQLPAYREWMRTRACCRGRSTPLMPRLTGRSSDRSGAGRCCVNAMA